MTVISSVPPCARSLGSKVACSNVEFVNVVVLGVPFTSTAEPDTNPVPVTLSVSALLPAGRLGGETVPPVGCGLLTVNVTNTDTRPPGLVTIT